MKNDMIYIGDVKLPLASFAISGTAWLGIRKAGKTYGAKGVAEQLMAAGIPIIVFDAIGVWRYLKTPGSGQFARGYEIVVAGGDEPDIPLTRDNCEEIVRAAMRAKVSLVIDLYDAKLSKRDWRAIVQKCFNVLMYENKQHGVRYIILEEAAEYCLDEKTEVLTSKGFIKITDVKAGDLVSCYDMATRHYQYNPAQRVISKQFSGDMIHIGTRSLDCLMTSDHRAVIHRFQHNTKRYKIYPPAFCEASKLPKAFAVPMGGASCGQGENISDEMLSIIGWVATDGCYHTKKLKYLSVSQSDATIKNGNKVVDKMRLVLKPYGATEHSRTRTTKTPDGKTVKGSRCSEFYLGAKLSTAVCDWMGAHIHRIPRRLIDNCDQRQLALLFHALIEGDGTYEGSKLRCFYPGLDEGLADDFQEIATKLGIGTVKSYTASQWRVSISTKRSMHWISKFAPKTIHFDGTVWCLTVPTGAFVARRNGTVFVTGNCPQRIEDGETYSAVEKVARMGGNAGLGLALINQRSQGVNKEVLEQCDNLVLMRQRGDRSIDSVEKWMKRVDKDKAAEIAKSLPNISNGQSWIWAEDSDEPVFTQTKKLRSFHPDREAHGADLKAHKPVDTAKFVSTLMDELPKVLAEKKASDPVELKKEIARLNQEVARLNRPAKVAPPATVTVYVPVLTEADRVLLHRIIDETPAAFEKFTLNVQKQSGAIMGPLQEIRDKLRQLTISAPQRTIPRPQTVLVAAEREVRPDRPTPQHPDGLKINGTQQRILDALAWYESIGIARPTNVQLGAVAMIDTSGGHFSNNAGPLVTFGLIDRGGGSVKLTDAGREYAKMPENLSTLEDYHKMLRERVQQVGGKRTVDMLEVMIMENGGTVTNQEIGAALAMDHTGGHFSNTIGPLSTLGLIDRRNGVVHPTDILFPKALKS